MLARRILGILRQYPNPEVAFFTALVASGELVYSGGETPRFYRLEPELERTGKYGDLYYDDNPKAVEREKRLTRLRRKHFVPVELRALVDEYLALRKQRKAEGRRLTAREKDKYKKVRGIRPDFEPFASSVLASAYAALHVAYPDKARHQALTEYLQFICGPEGSQFFDFVNSGPLTEEEEDAFDARRLEAKTREEHKAIDKEYDRIRVKRAKERFFVEPTILKYKGRYVPDIIRNESGLLHESGRIDHIVPWIAKIVNAWLKANKEALEYPLDLGWMEYVNRYNTIRPAGERAFLTEEEEYRAREFVDSAIRRMEENPTFADQMAARRRALALAYKQLDLLDANSRDIADWAIATRPNLLSLTVNQALYRSRRWHAALSRQQKLDAERELAARPGSVVFVTGPYTFYALDTKLQLEDEGECQSHCVGTYWKDVQEGKTTIYSMRTAEKRIATIEVRNGVEQQVMGRFNRELNKAEERKAVAEFFVYMKVSSREYNEEMKKVLAQPKPPETLSGLMGFGRAFGRFGYRC